MRLRARSHAFCVSGECLAAVVIAPAALGSFDSAGARFAYAAPLRMTDPR